MIINISAATVIESTLMYGIVHGIWLLIRKVSKEAYKRARTQRDHIIRMHVKGGHEGRLKHCVDDACASLRTPVLATASVQEQPEQLAPRIES